MKTMMFAAATTASGNDPYRRGASGEYDRAELSAQLTAVLALRA